MPRQTRRDTPTASRGLWQHSPAMLRLDGAERTVKYPVAAGALLLTAWSFCAQLRAATTWDVWAWNGSPISIDDRPERAWDWRDMQILRGLGARRDGG